MHQQELLERAIAFHGHFCPGLLIGYRAALIGLRELGVERAQDEELVAIAETDACGLDAVQVLTGCTMGKGNLILRDWGKQVFTFGRRSDGRMVRVALRYGVLNREGDQALPKAERLRDTCGPGTRSITLLHMELYLAARSADPAGSLKTVVAARTMAPKRGWRRAAKATKRLAIAPKV